MPSTDRRTTLQAWAAALTTLGWPQASRGQSGPAAAAAAGARRGDAPSTAAATPVPEPGADAAPLTAGRPQAALAARTLPEALAALGLPGLPQTTAELRIEAPELAENGSAVPVAVRWTGDGGTTPSLAATPPANPSSPDRPAQATSDGPLRLALLVEGNAQPLALLAELDPALAPALGTRLKFADSAVLWALLRLPDGRWFSQRASVRVVQGGCAV